MLKKVKRIKLGKQVYRRLTKKVLERDGWRCRKCGSLKDLQVHHRIRRSQQGHDALGNLVTLCAYCHMAEHGQLGYEAKAMEAIKKTIERGRNLRRSPL
jgi:5-methylcytosine-specific restriction endonuclease McrA